MDQQIVGIPWYTADSYAKCLSIYADASDQPDTFEDWIKLAIDAEQEKRDLGMRVERVIVDPKTLLAWCAAYGFRDIDAHARRAFASFKAAEAVGIKPIHGVILDSGTSPLPKHRRRF